MEPCRPENDILLTFTGKNRSYKRLTAYRQYDEDKQIARHVSTNYIVLYCLGLVQLEDQVKPFVGPTKSISAVSSFNKSKKKMKISQNFDHKKDYLTGI